MNPSTSTMLSFQFRFADKIDFCLMFLGVVGSIITGLSAPANTLIFGDLTDALVNSSLGILPTEPFLGICQNSKENPRP